MRTVILVLTLTSMLFMATAEASCLNDPVTNNNDSGQFMAAMVSALASFRSANARPIQPDVRSATDLLSSIDAVDDDLKCASVSMSNFAKSKNNQFAAVAREIADTAKELQQLNIALRKSLVDQLNGKYTNEQPGDHAQRMAALQTAYRDAWALLPYIATQSILAIEEFESPKSTKAARLSVTSAERKELNRSLQRSFPTVMTSTVAAKAQPEAAAFILYEGLNHKGFQMHDQPYVARSQR